jgi:hypothetical protein
MSRTVALLFVIVPVLASCSTSPTSDFSAIDVDTGENVNVVFGPHAAQFYSMDAIETWQLSDRARLLGFLGANDG